MLNKRQRVSCIIGSFAIVASCNFLLSGCGAGTGQSLNAPTLTSRSNTDGATGTATKAQTSSVLPSKRLGLFITDFIPQKSKNVGINNKPSTFTSVAKPEPATDYAHVFVTIHKVELVSADDQTFPIWSDDAGRVVDLTTLRDAIGERVALLGGVPAPGVTGKKTYKRARITLGKSITFLKKGETSGKATPIDDTIGLDDEGRPVLTVLIDRPRDLGTGKDDLIIAFDRTAFTFADGRVTPSLREAPGGINTDPSRQEAATFTGTVSEATAGGEGPERVFALTPESGTRGENLLIWLRSAAPFFRADGKPSPLLTDGIKVAVRGRLQPSTKRVLAESVSVLPEGTKLGEITSVLGTVGNTNAEGGSFTIGVKDALAIQPTYSDVTVTVAEDAIYRSTSGLPLTKDAFFAALKQVPSDEYAEVTGDYEPTTGVMTASQVRLVATKENALRETSVVATAKTVEGKSLTITAPLIEWDGIVPPATGKAWTVNTSAGTVCRDKEGKSIALADLLTAAKDPDHYAVHVTGTYAGGAITASRLELLPAPPKEVAKKSEKSDKEDAPTTSEKSGKVRSTGKTNARTEPKESSAPEATPTP